MNDFLAHLANLAQRWLDRQPDLALMLAAAVVVFWVVWLSRRLPALNPERFWQGLVLRAGVALGATSFTAGLLILHAGLRGNLQEVNRNFSAHHGRITEANRRAVETIWGEAQRQPDLTVAISYQEEIEERIQSAELDKPDIIHKIKKTTTITDNPFRRERHQVTLTANPRRKGSAVYAGYETDCHFAWKMQNPADRETDLVLTLPLPADDEVYFDLAATWNGVDILPQTRFADHCLILNRKLAAHEAFDFTVAFRSRGLESWYFQNDDPRELRDFELAVTLADIPVADLNYPEGCMTPTQIVPVGAGCRLTYRLDHALSPKGLGVALPKLEQPGQAVGGILGEAPRGWTMFFALLWLGLALMEIPHGWLMVLLCAAPTAYGFGLFADATDAGLPWYFSFAVTVLPLAALAAGAVVAVCRRRCGYEGGLLAAGLLLLSLGYPLAAGLDNSRVMMYRNFAGLVFIGVVAWLAVRRRRAWPAAAAAPVPAPVAA